MKEILSKLPYGNYKVLNLENELMFRCDDKKGNWYLQRGLAKVVSGNTIQLVFSPKGPGHVGDDFYLQEKSNKCVVCGAEDQLTKHHVVPRVYRKFFSEELKSHSSHDIVVLCIDCHKIYEDHASNLKQVIAQEFNMPVHGKGYRIDENLLHAKRAAATLLKYRLQMPAARVEELLQYLRDYYGKQEITDEEIQLANNIIFISTDNYTYHGKYVVDHLDDLYAFVKRWRKHFVAVMSPKFLPPFWDIERKMRQT